MDIQRLLDKLYHGVGNDDAMQQFMLDLNDQLGCPDSWIDTTDLASGRISLDIASHRNGRISDSYNSYLHGTSPYPQAVTLQATKGSVFFANDVLSHKRSKLTEYYDAWLKPKGMFDVAGVYLESNPQCITIAHFPRDTAISFTDIERQILELVAPHMIQVVELRRKIGKAMAIQNSFEATLNCHPFGVILLDYLGNAVFINKAANSIFHSSDGLSFHHGRLHLSHHRADIALVSILLKFRLACGSTSEYRVGEVIQVERRSKKSPYQIMVTEIRSQSLGFELGVPAICIFIKDPDTDIAVSLAQLHDLYGLTSAEAKVALSIARGMSLEEHADNNNQAVQTTRTLLKRVFAKTSTNRQNELANVIWQMSLPFNREEFQNVGSRFSISL